MTEETSILSTLTLEQRIKFANGLRQRIESSARRIQDEEGRIDSLMSADELVERSKRYSSLAEFYGNDPEFNVPTAYLDEMKEFGETGPFILKHAYIFLFADVQLEMERRMESKIMAELKRRLDSGEIPREEYEILKNKVEELYISKFADIKSLRTFDERTLMAIAGRPNC